ncbi:hypothetical protein DOY81_010488, partial [Sarcophaga bullata]
NPRSPPPSSLYSVVSCYLPIVCILWPLRRISNRKIPPSHYLFSIDDDFIYENFYNVLAL